ncbi:hypothetical protein [Sulfuriferula sp.]|uniref:hypothetical protein n=1 Tax=Sulfuriferula sp. TaxID=2025307 RepID=UPI00272F6332|nr:hypothetical protein [Sulfuriferula sp.]MDP2026035.1 hypothetical protein [Sulfuriferula sp.]
MKTIRGEHFFGAGIGQFDTVALRQREQYVRLQRAFQVDVQFNLGHAVDERLALLTPFFVRNSTTPGNT